MMTLSRLHLILLSAFLIATLAFIATAVVLIFEPGAVVREDTRDEASVWFRADRTRVFFAGDCMTVEWRVEGIQAVLLNGEGRVGEGREPVCGRDATLRVVFQDGEERDYRVTRTVLIEPVSRLALAVATAAALLWAALARRAVSPLAYGRRLGAAANRLLFAGPPAKPVHRLASAVALALLFAYGLMQWIDFYNNGSLEMDAYDWYLMTAYRAVLVESLETGELPFFITNSMHKTDRFLGNPEYPVTPHNLLLSTLTPGQFALIDTLVFYALGFVGLLLLRRRYRLSLAAFAAAFLLFNFNGQVTSHLGIGHAMWNANLLLPFFVLYLLQMVEGDRPTRAALLLALVFFVMALQAAFHLVIWCAFTLGFVALFQRRLLAPVAIAVGFGVLLAGFRFIPGALALSGSWHEGFRTGYPTVHDLLEGLTIIRDHTYSVDAVSSLVFETVYTKLYWWEFDLFIGVLALSFITYYGIDLRFRRRGETTPYPYRALDLPIAAMTALSFSVFYGYLSALPLPLLNAERVTSRFIILPFVIVVTLALIRFQQRPPRSLYLRLLILFGIAQTAVELRLHANVWRVLPLELATGPRTDDLTADIIPLAGRALSSEDTLYVLTVYGATILSVVALAAWAALYWREARRKLKVNPRR